MKIYSKIIIKDYKVLNNTVVICTFMDNTTEKATCDKEDVFDFERAIEICMMKRICRLFNGENSYNDYVNLALKDIKRIDEGRAKQKKIEEEHNRIIQNRRRKAAIRKEKKRQQRIDEMVEAFIKADSIINKNINYDDGK